jgi:AcrR family transcriptional regulator
MPSRPQKRQRLSREEQKAERSQQLLDAARAVFMQKGYEAVTIDDVAEHAGYSRMPVYTLFGDKQNLFFELWRTTTAELTEALVGGFKPGTSLRANLKVIADVLGNEVPAAEPPFGERLFFVVQTIALSNAEIGKKLEALARKVVSDVATFVRQSSLEKGEALRSDPETIAAHIVAHINGMATVQFQTRSRYQRAKDLFPIFCAIAFKNG